MPATIVIIEVTIQFIIKTRELWRVKKFTVKNYTKTTDVN